MCSYLLINFWHKRLSANKAALKAMLINRVADVFFLLAIVIIFVTFRSVDIIVISALVPFMVDETIYFFGILCRKIDLICFFLFLGAVGKSAQLGLHA